MDNALGTNCVQAVRIRQEKPVEILPQHPHPTAINSYQSAPIHILTHHTTTLSTILASTLSTDITADLTEEMNRLSPVSTPPITTTTIYI